MRFFLGFILMSIGTIFGGTSDGFIILTEPSSESNLCRAQCISRCQLEGDDVIVPLDGSLEQCISVECDPYLSDSWVGSICDNDPDCIARCGFNISRNDTELQPNLPNVTIQASASPYTVELLWGNDDHEFETEVAAPEKKVIISTVGDPIFVLENKAKKDMAWTFVDFTTETKFFQEAPDVCEAYSYRVAAVNAFGTKGFSEPVIRSNLPVPDTISSLSKGDIQFEDSYFVVFVQWEAPEGWLEDDIDRYVLTTTNHFCEDGNTGPPTPIYNPTDDSLKQFRIRIFHLGYLCTYRFTVEPVSRCGVFGDNFTFDIPLTNCSGIPGFICPPRPTKRPGAVKHVIIDASQGNPVTVHWGEPDLGTFPYIKEYALQWGPLDTNNPIFEIIAIVEDRKAVPGYITTTSFSVNNTDILYGFQIYPLSPDEEYGDIRWGMLSTTTFIVPSSTTSSTERSTIDEVDDKHLSKPPNHIGYVPTPTSSRNEDLDSNVVLTIVVPLVAIVMGVMVASFMIYRRRRIKSQRRRQREMEFEVNKLYTPMGDAANVTDDKWEIAHERLVFGEVLGRGAFGQVSKGYIKGEAPKNMNTANQDALIRAQSINKPVAIKMIHEYALESSKEEFTKEINLMKKIGSHPNVVSMIGCCTIHEPICLIVEHVPDGDLLHYLRKHRINLLKDGGSKNSTSDGSEDTSVVQVLDMLSFARQIAMGMDFLSDKGFVHRDLAARNILVGQNKTVKISDFGLTRSVYNDNVYVPQKGGKLPLKWMSIEAISDLTFTSASDVWSYGIVIFEIITMGGTPYPTIANMDLLKLLRDGYRMEKPDNCPDDLYDLMIRCWKVNPSDRPTFAELKIDLERMMEENSNVDYMDFSLDESKDYYVFEESQQSESVLCEEKWAGLGPPIEVAPGVDNDGFDRQSLEEETPNGQQRGVNNTDTKIGNAGGSIDADVTVIIIEDSNATVVDTTTVTNERTQAEAPGTSESMDRLRLRSLSETDTEHSNSDEWLIKKRNDSQPNLKHDAYPKKAKNNISNDESRELQILGRNNSDECLMLSIGKHASKLNIGMTRL
ncbi:unnamed protein product [Owenia fusiformis]|uniref:receptor protein-tyrosine kinase n=1 Tax=Owenia fusiformis TaxID=6347 RepID=A0A8J1XW42_OWEFU|nr:unnamed protein product [Owenia fusiformis]